MNTHNRFNHTVLFSFTIAAFFAFFLYMGMAEQVTVYQAEQTHSYQTLTDLNLEIILDDTAPAGIRKVYRGILVPELSQESCLCFNIAHHSIQVYFDDVLVYSLTGSQSNHIGRNVSSNWCSVHVGQAHAGESVTVVLTPIFQAAIGKNPEFLLGSHYAIVIDILLGELPLLILSAMCILLGLFIFAVFLYFHYFAKKQTNGMSYLGLFSVMLGLWKLTDLRCMPLLIPEHAMALGYISVGSLFLTGLCLLTYFSTLFTKDQQKTLLLLSCIGAAICLAVLAAQILGFAEIRQNLVYCHILLIVALLAVPLAALRNRILYKNWGLQRSWKLLLILIMGIALDLVLYYRNNDTGLLSFSIIGFIVYTLIIFLNSVQDSTRKAYTDSRTGLVNRTHWNELMHSTIPIPKPYAILVVDLNGLKRVNDTLGHEAGDQMILQLSNILRNTLPRSSVICRWGGDEFAVMLTGMNRIQVDQQVNSLFTATQLHNANTPELPISFAIGTALSSEHPDISRSDLFRLADDEMYRNKQIWYTQQLVTH